SGRGNIECHHGLGRDFSATSAPPVRRNATVAFPVPGRLSGRLFIVETISAPADKLSQRALSALGKLPPFSPILNKLLASLAGEDVSFAKVGELIEKDAVVAGNIMHLVNSALYARRATITSVRHALALLGM